MSSAEQPDPQDSIEKGPDSKDLRGLSPGEAASQIEQERKPKTLWGRIKYFFVGEKLDRKRLAALGVIAHPLIDQLTTNSFLSLHIVALKRVTPELLLTSSPLPGLGAVASYGFVSNATYGTGDSI